jgi:hypothetical protein
MKKFAEKPRTSATSGAIDKIPSAAELFPRLSKNRKHRARESTFMAIGCRADGGIVRPVI